MTELVTLIGNLGFPIAITLYVLVRLESKMEKLTDTIVKLTNVLEIKNNSL